MHGVLAKACLIDGKAKFVQVDSLQEMFPLAENDRRDCQVYFVDLTGCQILADHGYTPADTYLCFSRRFPGPLQRGVGPISNKVERRATLHL